MRCGPAGLAAAVCQIGARLRHGVAESGRAPEENRVHLLSSNFAHGQRIPEQFAFCAPDPAQHVRMSANRNPHLRWTGVPSTARSLVLLCVDTDVPTRADDVNKEGRIVPADLPRTNFHHWVLVDLPPSVTEI